VYRYRDFSTIYGGYPWLPADEALILLTSVYHQA
jgi:hypothetical protein